MAHVAAHGGIDPRAAQQVAHQVGHGGFAVGARNANPGHLLAAVPGGSQFTPHRDPVLTERAEGWMVPANPWTDHHGLGLLGQAREGGGG